MLSRFPRAVALAPLLFAATVGARAENVTIDQQAFTTQKTTVTLKGVQVTDSSLSKDDFVKMLAPSTPDAERAQLIKSFKASKLVIPTVEVKDAKSLATVRDIVGEKIDGGRFAKFSVAGAEGANGDEAKFKANALTMEDGDFSSVATALAAGDPKQLGTRVGSSKFDGFTATIREDGPKDKAGTVDLALAGAESRTVMDGDVPKSATFAARNLTVTPQKNSKFGRDLAAFGYDKLDVSTKGAISYDAASRAFKIDDFTIEGVNAGALTLAAALGSVDKTFSAADPNQRLAAFMGADISTLSLKFVNQGLFDRALAYVAGSKSKESVRADWAKAAGQYIPIFLGGDAGALALAGEVQKFINDPKNLTLSAKGKTGPVRLMELPGLKDPGELLKRIDLSAAANK